MLVTNERDLAAGQGPDPAPTPESPTKRGQLCVFLGPAPGAGKTYAMLAEALRQKRAGRDVVIGCIQPRGYGETDALGDELKNSSSTRHTENSEGGSTELHLSDLLARRAEVVVIDEIANSNPPGCRHAKRYQDVIELLEAGIAVLTTLNVQNLASRADTAARITGIRITDTLPDSVLDEAEIELVDLSPGGIISRFREGKACLPKSACVANSHFFREGNLAALREMALRLAAEHAGQRVTNYMQSRRIEGPWKSGHRLLVGVGAGAVSEQVVRWSRRLADSLNCPWLAVYVETSRGLARAEQPRVTKNLALARELGAEIITTTDNDVVRGLLRVSASRNVTQIVVGKPHSRPLWNLLRGELILRKLLRDSGEIDVHLVRTARQSRGERFRPWLGWVKPPWSQYLGALGMVTLMTIACYFLQPLVGVHSTALIFLFGVVLLAMFVSRGPTLLAAVLSALVWDYYFLPPAFEFRVENFEDGMLLFMYVLVALVLGHFTNRIRAQEVAEREREVRATTLHQLAEGLNQAGNLDEMIKKVVEQAGHAFKAPIAVYLAAPGDNLVVPSHPASFLKLALKDEAAALWAFEHRQPAGKFTNTLSTAECFCLPLTAASRALGVVAFQLPQGDPPTMQQRNFLEAFCRQTALAVDRHRLKEEAENTRLLAESERLGKALLNSISHELRTPIAVIQSAVGNLSDVPETPGTAESRTMLAEIQEATDRLNRLVGNILDVARLESGHVEPALNLCDIGDLVHLAVKEMRKTLSQHRLTIAIQPDLPLVSIDYVLMQQSLINLLSNAAIHTPPGTGVEVSARLETSDLVLSVADRGPGMPSASMERLFTKFYRSPNAATGGTGLGLSLVKGFVEAQGGNVTAQPNPGGGLLFCIRLPLTAENTAIVASPIDAP